MERIIDLGSLDRPSGTSLDGPNVSKTFHHQLNASHIQADQHLNIPMPFMENPMLPSSLDITRTQFIEGSEDSMLRSRNDPNREINKLKQQLKQKQSCIQALHNLFNVLLEKIEAVLGTPETAAIWVDPRDLNETRMEGIEMVSQMFSGATGINPEPLLTGIEVLHHKLQTLIKIGQARPKPAAGGDVSTYLSRISVLERSLQSSQAKVQHLEHIIRQNELMKVSLERDISRLRDAKQQCMHILQQSEKQKQELVTQHELKYHIIRQNYGRNGEVSPEVVVLLDKIYSLEKKLRDKELEVQREHEQQVATMNEMLQLTRELKAEKKLSDQQQRGNHAEAEHKERLNGHAAGGFNSLPRAMYSHPVS